MSVEALLLYLLKFRRLRLQYTALRINVALMLGQRRRRWPNIKATKKVKIHQTRHGLTLAQRGRVNFVRRLVFVGVLHPAALH